MFLGLFHKCIYEVTSIKLRRCIFKSFFDKFDMNDLLVNYKVFLRVNQDIYLRNFFKVIM